MVVIMKREFTPEQLEAAVHTMEEGGVKVMVSKGAETTILGAEGNAEHIDQEKLSLLPGVERVMRVTEPYKKANRKYHPEDTVIELSNGLSVGGNRLAVIAGPCSVESEAQIVGVAQAVKASGAAALRGGAQDEDSQMAAITAHASELAELAVEEDEILRCCGPLTAEDRVFLARHPERPHIDETINALFTDFFEQCGDRQCREDRAILGGIARFHGMPVTVIGHRKGSTLEENMACNFGMPGPEGYRKALRLMKQAEKFGRPIITFIDTPGAYPGKEAEERGQGEAIARNLMEMSGLTVPVIAVVTGEGSSGGALALGVANHILMLENAVYSVLSPEGFASILWKDASRSGEACEIMKLTAQDLYKDGIVEEIIPEPVGGAQRSHAALFAALDTALKDHLTALCKMSGKALADQRYKKFRQIGEAKRA